MLCTWHYPIGHSETAPPSSPFSIDTMQSLHPFRFSIFVCQSVYLSLYHRKFCHSCSSLSIVSHLLLACVLANSCERHLIFSHFSFVFLVSLMFVPVVSNNNCFKSYWLVLGSFFPRVRLKVKSYALTDRRVISSPILAKGGREHLRRGYPSTPNTICSPSYVCTAWIGPQAQLTHD